MSVDPAVMEQAISSKEAALLGVVQGITEYLPVSSSGHLTLAQHMLGYTEPEIFFDIVLHLGTLAAVTWYYRKSLLRSISETTGGLRAITGGAAPGKLMAESEGFRLWVLVFLALIPTGIIGLSMKKWFEAMFEQPVLVGVMLIITGAVLFLTRFARQKGSGILDMGVMTALAVGAVQGLAVAPGISRSGATICVALFLGVERETAARFSFILSIPAVLGALLLKMREDLGDVAPEAMATGFLTSAVVGYLCLALLIFIVKKGRLSWFSAYCVAVGAFAIYNFS
ncbi:MAG: undecaprenyl-diphosphate phosphatase [Nitrospinota bacterium]|nr:undecaprenyl-diphosphate phosphatase [Nitrospinota bacterium]